MLGIKIKKIDKSSRRLDLKIGIENNSQNQNLIKKEYIQEIIEVIVEELEKIIKKR